MGNCSSSKQSHTPIVLPLSEDEIVLQTNKNCGTTYPDFIVRFNHLSVYIHDVSFINNSINLLHYKMRVAKNATQYNLLNNDIQRLMNQIKNLSKELDCNLFSDFAKYIAEYQYYNEPLHGLFTISNVLLNFNEYDLYLDFLKWTRKSNFLIIYSNSSDITPIIFDKLLSDKTNNKACLFAIELIYDCIDSNKKRSWYVRYPSTMALVEQKILTNNNLILSK